MAQGQPWIYLRLQAFSCLGLSEGTYGGPLDLALHTVPPNPPKDTHPRTRAPKNRKTSTAMKPGERRGSVRAQAACNIRYWGSNDSPFFQRISAMAAILRARVTRASSGFMPLANRRS